MYLFVYCNVFQIKLYSIRNLSEGEIVNKNKENLLENKKTHHEPPRITVLFVTDYCFKFRFPVENWKNGLHLITSVL